MNRLAALAFGLTLFAGADAALAQPRSTADCEKIEAWDAYNKCLAEFGPKRGGVARVTPMTAQEAETPAAPRSVSRGRASRADAGVMRRRSGRAYAVFNVGGPPRAAQRRRR